MTETTDKARVVVAAGYDKNNPNATERPVLTPQDIRPDQRTAEAKSLLFAAVKEIVSLIRLDRNDVVETIISGQRAQVTNREQEVLSDPFAGLATALFESWREEQIELPYTSLYVGVCGHEPHSWFRAEMSAEECGEPDYYYIIDPFARGLSVIHLGPESAESDFTVVKPWSPFNKMYFGKRVGFLKPEQHHG